MKSIYSMGLLLAMLFPAIGHAATVSPVYEKVSFVVGTETFSDSFTVPVAGTYKATLTDQNYPAPFATLLLAVSTSQALLGGADLSTPQFTFEAQPGVTYFASIAAIAGPGMDIGLFGADVALVPIPAAAMLFASALISLLVVARRRAGGQQSSAAAAAA